MKTALVHYWFVGQRGGEAVVEALSEILPEPELFAHVVEPDQLFGSLKALPWTETFIGRLPLAKRFYQAYLPLMPLALEALDMQKFDLIISSEAGPAKWVIPNPNARHICYCHSPLRYIWDQQHVYMKRLPSPIRTMANLIASDLRRSDVVSSARVDTFVANSSFVAKRINKFYRRDAIVVHPPVAVEDFLVSEHVEDYYLMAGEIRNYKRIDLAIHACKKLGRKLVIAGGGKVPKDLIEAGRGHVDFLGPVSFSKLKALLSQCRALLYPGIEDFGIVPVEAMASGRPVIAYGVGGARDTIEHEKTGLFFNKQTIDGLASAILEFEQSNLGSSSLECVKQAQMFSRQIFQSRFKEVLDNHDKSDRP
jgi:glycosyltransferase involved in cell wall biosynthesis